MIRRILAWTPPNLAAAFVVATVISSLLVLLFVFSVMEISRERYKVSDPLPGLSDVLAAAPIIGLIFIGIIMTVGVGFALFGIFPLALFSDFFTKPRSGIVAAVWGGLAGTVIGMAWTDPSVVDVATTFGCGAICGLVWWTLAHRVIKSRIARNLGSDRN